MSASTPPTGKPHPPVYPGLLDKTLLLTGTTGIAAATARLAATQGARVFLVGIDRESGEELARELGEACRFHRTDVTVAAEVADAVEICARDLGRIDGLFNVVGISGRSHGDGPVHECTEEGWDRTLEVNLKSTFLTCRQVISRMLEQSPDPARRGGAVLNMASVLGTSPSPHFFATHAYAASKAAVIGLTRSMAAYYAPQGIRVNAIAPGLVRTPMSRRAQEDPEIVEFMTSKQPLLAGFIPAEDVAHTALFLLGDGSRSITGEVVAVDAGWSVSG